MHVRNKSILKYDYLRVTKKRDELVDQFEMALHEVERIRSEIERCDVEITELANEFDELSEHPNDIGVSLSMR